jgi:2-polyprenyl-3-methyl-5-hydroxy-6-metoxy-1,4-benzoquinol methylase
MTTQVPEKHPKERACERIPYSLELFENDGFGNRVFKSMPTPSELDDYYAKNFARQSYTRFGKKLEAFRRARFSRSLLSKSQKLRPAVLEVGSGNGQFLAAFRRLSPDATLSAVEFENPALIAVAAAKRITCFDSLEALEPQRESYDLIALWHVVEHMIDPWSHLIRLLPLLKPEGIIVFSTPNMFCPGVRRFPASWPWNQSPPVHLWHFGPQNLQKKLEYLFPKLMVKVFTRESRDANFLFDSLIRPQFFARLPHSVRNNLRFQAGVRLFVACINEALLNPVLRRKGFGGAEIIALVENG